MPDLRWALKRLAGRAGQLMHPLTAHQSTELERLTSGMLSTGPTFSIVMPVYDPPRRWLERAVESVQQQIYPRWELCISDDASPTPWLGSYLASLTETEARVKVVRRARNGHISAASNSALDLATGAWTVLLDQDDELSPLALLHLALHLRSHPDSRMIYSDEDMIDTRGWRYNSYRKPDFNPDLLLSQNLVSHLGAFSTSLLRHLGGFREGYEGSQDHDVALRVAAASSAVGHIPHVLYHWRTLPTSTASGPDAKSYALEAGVRAIQDAVGAAGRCELVARTPPFRGYRIVPTPPAPGRTHILQVRPDGSWVSDIPEDASPADVLILVSESASVPADAGWQAEVAGHLSRAGIGAVGGAIVDQSSRIIDGGLWLGPLHVGDERRVHAAFLGMSLGLEHRFSRAQVSQTVRALSASFLATTVEIANRVGFDRELGGYADVDFCLRLADSGLRCLWVPEIRLLGARSQRRPAGPELVALRAKHPSLDDRDGNVPPSTRPRSRRYGTRLLDDSLGIDAALSALRAGS